MKRVALLLCLSSFAFAQNIELPHTLSNGSVADADELMANFNVLLTKANGDDSRITDIEAIISLDNSPFEEGALDAGVENGVWTGDEKQGNFLLGPGTTTAVLKTPDNAFNTSLGVDTLSNLSRGFSNVAIGYRAMRDASGTQTETPAAISSNVAVGAFALEDLRDYPGIGNTAIGDRAMYRATSAAANTGVGAEVLQQLTTGYGNVGVGNTGLRGTTTGGRNVALGLRALGDNITGSDNIAVGFRADVAAPDLFNATVIGSGAEVDASNKVRIGNTDVTVIQGQVAFTSSSDARLKDSITPVSDGLALVNDLNPVSYHRKANPASDVEMGLLAQEVEATLEKHGLGNSGMVHQPAEDAYMSLRYNDLMAPMIRAIQELDDASEAKDAQIASLQEQLQSQQGKLQSHQEELLVLVQSQQEQIAQLQRMVEQQFAVN